MIKSKDVLRKKKSGGIAYKVVGNMQAERNMDRFTNKQEMETLEDNNWKFPVSFKIHPSPSCRTHAVHRHTEHTHRISAYCQLTTANICVDVRSLVLCIIFRLKKPAIYCSHSQSLSAAGEENLSTHIRWN